VEEPSDRVYRTYMGGSALMSYFLLRELAPGVDPLGPDNVFLVMTGVICGLPLSGTNRYSVGGKSPLTGGFGESEAGGYFGPELKRAGFDGIIVQGQAAEPVYLYIHDEMCEIRNADDYWGRLSGEVQEGLQAELGDDRVRVLQTGVAGERGVRYAGLVNELHHFHGRAGLGAVMGSKRLKAIVAWGTGGLEMADQETAVGVSKELAKAIDLETDPLHLYGTARGAKSNDMAGLLPTRNFQKGSFSGAEAITGETIAETILVDRGTCWACARRCKREVSVPERDVAPKYGGPEYETIASLGSLCEVDDLEAIAEAAQWCNRYVLDSISTGVSIAFAMECYEHGILTREDTDDIDLTWGDGEAVIKLIHKIAHREGIGDLLADGVKRAAAQLGQGSAAFAMHVKGQELPMHEPRGKVAVGLGYAVSPTGADHLEADHDTGYVNFGALPHHYSALGLIEGLDPMVFGPEKVRAFVYSQAAMGLYNCVGMCDFIGKPWGPLPLEELRDFINAVTGWRTSIFDLMKVGERANTLARLFNVREGFSRADDTLPRRLFEPLENGAHAGDAIDQEAFEAALTQYYRMAGWDDEGVPTTAKLDELGLSWTASLRESSR